MPDHPTVSVVIPVKDGERYLGEVLAALAREDDGALEVLVVDSGSRDGSLEIARAAGVELLEIAPAEFGHGRTRNLGAERSRGELIAFLTQDATPIAGWLAAYREAFALADDVGAAFGPQLPRPDTGPIAARSQEEVFARFGGGTSVDFQRRGANSFLSNVNACYSRRCWEQIRFPDLGYAEDQAFGEALLERDWAKVFHPGAAVLHAHDYGVIEGLRRQFDEGWGYVQATGWRERFGVRTSLREMRKGVSGDWRWMADHDVPPGRRLAWAARGAVFHGGRRGFRALGASADRLPAGLRRALSLEGRTR